MLQNHKVGCALYGLVATVLAGIIVGSFWLLTAQFHLTKYQAVTIILFAWLVTAFIVMASLAFATQGDDPKWVRR